MAESSKTADVSPAESLDGAVVDETSLGPDENVLAALSYLFGILSGLLVYFLEKDSEFARFHAAQCVVLSATVIAGSFALMMVSLVLTFALGDVFLIGWIVGLGFTFVWFVAGVAGFGVWVYAIVSAFRGKRLRLPLVAGVAENYLL